MNDLPQIPTPGAPAVEPQATPEPAPLRSMPGRRGGMSVSVNCDGSYEVTRHEGGPAVRHVEPSSGPVRFYREGSDTPILGRNASMHDVVDLGGAIGRTSIGAALHNGWLLENEHGGYERAGEAAPRAPQPQPRQTEQQTEQQAQEPAPAREDLLPDDEAYLQSVEQAVGPDLFANVQAAMIDVEAADLSDNLVSQVAAKLGVDRDLALAHISQAAAPFQAQAAAKLDWMFGEAAHEEIFAWGQSDPVGKQLLGAAMRQQVHERSTEGYAKLGAAWLASEAKRDPIRIAQGLSAGGVRAKVEGGKVIVNLPGLGEAEIVAALRSGLLRLGR